DAAHLEGVAENGGGNGARAEGLRTPGHARLHRSEHISAMVRRSWDQPGARGTQAVRRRGRSREIWRSNLTGCGSCPREPRLIDSRDAQSQARPRRLWRRVSLTPNKLFRGVPTVNRSI